MTLGAGLVLMGCGDDDTATTPAPAPPPPPPPAPEPEPEPEPPAPEAPATPTGLHVDEVTVDSITWHWNAVEGAAGYAVQVSLDEMFDDTDQIGLTLETHFTATPVPPATNVYLRVRAGTGTPEALAAAVATGSLEGLALSDWSTHVTGRTDMIVVPPPPPPAAVMVTFTPPDPNDDTLDLMCERNAGSPMCPDDSRNMATATAMVNPDMMVMSNATAVIVPMNFAEGANPVKVHEGENMPFTYVNWEALQSMVVTDGAQFKIMRVTLGANQEEEPTGDVAYVTCGPFECVEGMDAPEISVENSTVCTTFEADVQFVAGIVDPQGGDDRNGDGTTGDNYNKGIDLGIAYTANAGFRTTHDFGSFSKTGFSGSKTSSLKALKRGIPDTSTPSTTDNTNIEDAAGNVVVDIAGCEDVMHALYTMEGPSALDKPEECSRVLSTSGYAYYRDYSVTITPSAGLSWSRNTWPQIPRGAAARCSGTTFMASDQVDVCELLEDEVALIDEGTVMAIPVVSVGDPLPTTPAQTNVNATNQAKLQGFDLKLPIDPTRWKHLRYNDDTTAARYDDLDLYDTSRTGTPLSAAVKTSDGSNAYTFNDSGRLNGMAQDGADGTAGTADDYANVWVPIRDSKGAPMYGDLGKVDAATRTQASEVVDGDSEDELTEGHGSYTGPFGGDNVPDNFAIGTYNGSADARACSAEDGGENGSGSTRRYLADGSDPGAGAVESTAANPLFTGAAAGRYDIVSLRTGGSLCDAEGVEIETSVTFKDDMGLGCSVERSFTLTCDWDASGGMTPHQAQKTDLVPGSGVSTAMGNIGEAQASDFVSCTVEMN